MQWGGTAAIIGLLIVLLTYFFIDAPSVQIAGFAAGGVLALTGIILDLIGEIIVAKDYKNQIYHLVINFQTYYLFLIALG